MRKKQYEVRAETFNEVTGKIRIPSGVTMFAVYEREGAALYSVAELIGSEELALQFAAVPDLIAACKEAALYVAGSLIEKGKADSPMLRQLQAAIEKAERKPRAMTKADEAEEARVRG
jgi:hypothetical protein